MSFVLKSGADSTLATVDPVSKALRTTLYRPDGAVIFPTYDGSYLTRIEVVPTTLTGGTTYFSMRNLGSKRVFIRRIEMKWGFSGTAAATRSIFDFQRFSTATPTAGTTQTALKKDNVFATSSVTDIRFAPGGLTTTSVVFESSFFIGGISSNVNCDHAQDLHFLGDGEHGKFVLAVNEGMCIRANGTVVAGAFCIGQITWDERT